MPTLGEAAREGGDAVAGGGAGDGEDEQLRTFLEVLRSAADLQESLEKLVSGAGDVGGYGSFREGCCLVGLWLNCATFLIQ